LAPTFRDYLRDLPELAALPYVAEMACFEFARIVAYNAPAEQYTQRHAGRPAADQLEALPIFAARGTRGSSRSARPVLPLWKAHQNPEPDLSGIDMTPRLMRCWSARPDRHAGGQHWMRRLGAIPVRGRRGDAPRIAAAPMRRRERRGARPDHCTGARTALLARPPSPDFSQVSAVAVERVIWSLRCAVAEDFAAC